MKTTLKAHLITCLILLYSCLSALEITVEHARTPNEISWGLMNRTCLAPNHGMLFTFPRSQYLNVWMFNCQINLSVAFIDRNHRISEIYELKAYPEMMDPLRPVRSLKDMDLYPSHDPIYQFFLDHAVSSLYPAKFMLEMPERWFQKQHIQPGDQLFWNATSNQAWFVTQQKSSLPR